MILCKFFVCWMWFNFTINSMYLGLQKITIYLFIIPTLEWPRHIIPLNTQTQLLHLPKIIMKSTDGCHVILTPHCLHYPQPLHYSPTHTVVTQLTSIPQSSSSPSPLTALNLPVYFIYYHIHLIDFTHMHMNNE